MSCWIADIKSSDCSLYVIIFAPSASAPSELILSCCYDSVEFPRLISLACLIGVTEVADRTFIQEERDPRKGKIRIGVEVRETIFEIMRQLQAQHKL